MGIPKKRAYVRRETSTAANPKPITAARKLFEQLYRQQRPITEAEWMVIDVALESADARTRLDPSERK